MRALRRDGALSSGPKALLMNVSKKVARSPLWAGQGEGAAGRACGSRWRRRTVCVCVCAVIVLV